MNWYKLAQSLPFNWDNVEGIVYTTEAQNDLNHFKKSQDKRSAQAVSVAVKENLDSRTATLRESVRKNNVRIYVFEPHGIGLAAGPGKAYRICTQLCSLGGETATSERSSLREQEGERTGKKFLLVKRIFEDHDEYLKWFNVDTSKHRDDCGLYSRVLQRRAEEGKIVPLDVGNPHPWLAHVVGLIRDRNIQGAQIHKEMLSGKSADELEVIMDSVNKFKSSLNPYMLSEIYGWIEEYWDKLNNNDTPGET